MGPPVETKPDYENMHGPLGKIMDKVFMTVFRTQMANKIGMDSQLPKVSESLLSALHGRVDMCRLCCLLFSHEKDDYAGLMELASALNARYSDQKKVQLVAQDVLSK
jgi:hypothetical protein